MTSIKMNLITSGEKKPVVEKSEKMLKKPKNGMPIEALVFLLVISATTISVFSYNSIHWVVDELKAIPSYDSKVFLAVDVISMAIQVCYLCDLLVIIIVLLMNLKAPIKIAVTVVITLTFLSAFTTITFYVYHTFFNNTGTPELVKAFTQNEDSKLQLLVDNFQQENKCCGVSNFHDWIKNDTCIKKRLECELPASCCDQQKITKNNETCTVRVQPWQKVDNDLQFLNGLFTDGCYAILDKRRTQALFVFDFNSCMVSFVMVAVAFMLESHRKRTIEEEQ